MIPKKTKFKRHGGTANYVPDKVLKNWRSLISRVTVMTEEELLACITVEAENQKRPLMLQRLYRHYNRLRKEREKEELLNDVI